MKKISLVVKEVSENRIQNTLKASSAVFVIKYPGVSSPDLCNLRLSLKGAGANIFVVKNSVARRAFKNSGLEGLIKSVEGPCGLVFSKDEPVATSRILCDFRKEHEQLKLEGGSFNDKIIENKDIETMSKLPSKDILRAQVVGTLNGPIVSFVLTLNQVLAGFVCCLNEIKDKKPK